MRAPFRLRSILVTTLACATLATPLAARDAFTCTFPERSKRGPAPATLTVDVEPGKWVAFVKDEFTEQLSARPINAEIDLYSPKRIKLKWKLVGLDYKGFEHRVTDGVVNYNLNINLATNGAVLNGVDREYYSQVYGHGTCVRN